MQRYENYYKLRIVVGIQCLGYAGREKRNGRGVRSEDPEKGCNPPG